MLSIERKKPPECTCNNCKQVKKKAPTPCTTRTISSDQTHRSTWHKAHDPSQTVRPSLSYLKAKVNHVKNGKGNEVKGPVGGSRESELDEHCWSSNSRPGRTSQQKALPRETLLITENQWDSAIKRSTEVRVDLRWVFAFGSRHLHLVEGGKRHLTREQNALARSSKTMDCWWP